ncbi:hypothetical protein AB0M94_06545 [Streptomyces xanthochromogenes]|uniref:DUF6907 domain-containing protein n=1 Tax=Streptomyces xanthochromogenes TaxID=67384 RepID=UPI00341F36F1
MNKAPSTPLVLDQEEWPLDPAAETYSITLPEGRSALIAAEIYESDDPDHPKTYLAVYPGPGSGDDLDVAGADKLIADLEQFLPRLRALRNHLAQEGT